MSRVSRSRSPRNNPRCGPSRPLLFVFAAALALLTGACGGSEAEDALLDRLFVAPVETQVWNNRMPGTRPRCNAVLRLQLVNRSEEDIALHSPEGMVVSADGALPLRRFTPLMSISDRPQRDLTIAPGDSVEVAFRSPDFGLEPIDTQKYPRVRYMLRLQSSLEQPLQFGSPVTAIFETQ